jgi:hypothetical protein
MITLKLIILAHAEMETISSKKNQNAKVLRSELNVIVCNYKCLECEISDTHCTACDPDTR